MPEQDDDSTTAPRNEIATAPADTVGQPRRLVVGHLRWRRTFAAFRHRNYRLFFSGQLTSLIGTWMQTVAEGWLIYQLTGSSLALGLIRFLHTAPVTLLSFVAGAVADRSNKRSILLVTQTGSLILAVALTALVFFDWVKVWHVGVIGVLLGVAHAFDIPTRQSLTIEMVGKKDLMNAIALNSSMFNGARVIGPALAGILIGWVGVVGCFFVNALSYLAVIASYLGMRFPSPPPVERHQSIRQATMEAVRLVTRDPVLRVILGLVMVVSLFGWPYSVLMPIFAGEILDIGAKGYGYLMAANGLGAFIGAITLASLGDYPHKLRLLFTGALGFCLMILLFSLARNPWLSAMALLCSGWFMIVFFATANTTVQLSVADNIRGRIMGIYSFCFIGVSPLGSLQAGIVARWTSAPFAIAAGACVCAAASIVAFLLLRKTSFGRTIGPRQTQET